MRLHVLLIDLPCGKTHPARPSLHVPPCHGCDGHPCRPRRDRSCGSRRSPTDACWQRPTKSTTGPRTHVEVGMEREGWRISWETRTARQHNTTRPMSPPDPSDLSLTIRVNVLLENNKRRHSVTTRSRKAQHKQCVQVCTCVVCTRKVYKCVQVCTSMSKRVQVCTSVYKSVHVCTKHVLRQEGTTVQEGYRCPCLRSFSSKRPKSGLRSPTGR